MGHPENSSMLQMNIDMFTEVRHEGSYPFANKVERRLLCRVYKAAAQYQVFVFYCRLRRVANLRR